MDPTFLSRLLETARTGQAPPRPSKAGSEPMQPIHEQLLASLQERQALTEDLHANDVRTVPIVTPGTAEGLLATTTAPPGPAGPQSLQSVAPMRYEESSQFKRSRTKFDAPARAARARPQKGTIEEVLGEIAAVPRGVDGTPLGPLPDLPVGSAHDDRAGDGEPAPRNPSLSLRCPICEGKGFLTLGPVTRFCGRCGGEGYVEDPAAAVGRQRAKGFHVERADGTTLLAESKAEQQVLQQAVDMEPYNRAMSAGEKALRVEADALIEAALQREAAGEQWLPLEVEQAEPSIEAKVPASVSIEEVGTLASASAQPVLLSYDLPTSLDALPPFCFICGPAGTGKTFQAKAWAASDPEGVVLAATTGIAAVNLGEGTTINALLRFYDTNSLRDAFTGGWLESQLKRQRGAGLRRIVLDEVSMLDGDQLTIICRAIDNVNADRGADDAELGLVLVGDFAQLPVVGALDRVPTACFAFESAEWERYHAATYGLTTIRRQIDRDFMAALQAVRRGDVAAALDFFGPRLEQVTLPSFQGTTILAKNDAVGKFNALLLDKVKGRPLEFASSRWGKLRSEWGGPPKPSAEWGVPEVLRLKIGALVMILANRNVAERGAPPEYAYVNGDLGTLVEASEKGTATVVLQRTGEEVTVVPVLRENLIPLEVGRRKALKEEGHSERISADGKHEVIGACHYLPLRLAYASTVHKSQGLSLDQVQVNIRDHFFSTPGMLYVALSRARTAEGLRVVGTPEGFRARCVVSERIRPWL